MKEYELIDDLTSDVMFKSYGKDVNELFVNSAKAMFDVICDIVPAEEEISFEIEAKDLENLLYAYLSRLIAEYEINELFFSEFSVIIDGNKLKAIAKGSPADPSKGKTQVKAVTMYKFKIKKNKESYEATVSCDI